MLNFDILDDPTVNAPNVTSINSNFARVETLGKRLPDIIETLMLNHEIGRKSWFRLSGLRESLKKGGRIEKLEYLQGPLGEVWKELNKRIDNWRTANFIDIEYYFYFKILEITGFWFQVKLREDGSFVKSKGFIPIDHTDISQIDPFYASKKFAFDATKNTDPWKIVNSNCSNINNLVKENSQSVSIATFLEDVLIKQATSGNLADLSQRKVDNGRIKDNITWCWNESEALRSEICKLIENSEPDQYVDYITDNSQSEFIADCQLIYFLVKVANVKVRVWIRTVPVFVSDLLYTDILSFQRILGDKSKKDLPHLADLQACLKNEENIEYITHPDMDSPKCFHEFDNEAKRYWAESKLIIIKGDLNYRKLVQDKHWDPTTVILKSENIKAPIFALRAIKSETLVNIPKSKPVTGEVDLLDTLTAVKQAVQDAVDDRKPGIDFPIMIQQF